MTESPKESPKQAAAPPCIAGVEGPHRDARGSFSGTGDVRRPHRSHPWPHADSPSVEIARNVDCVSGANVFRFQPSQSGPPAGMLPGALAIPLVTKVDERDYGVCGQVSGTLTRRVSVVIRDSDGDRAVPLGEFSSSASSAPPEVTLYSLSDDGHGGILAPWVVTLADGQPPQPHLTRINADGTAELPMPAVGEIHRWRNLGAMTDGKTLVTFDVATGKIQWVRVFPAGGLRILPGPIDGTIRFVSHDREVVDEFGRPIE